MTVESHRAEYYEQGEGIVVDIKKTLFGYTGDITIEVMTPHVSETFVTEISRFCQLSQGVSVFVSLFKIIEVHNTGFEQQSGIAPYIHHFLCDNCRAQKQCPCHVSNEGK